MHCGRTPFAPTEFDISMLPYAAFSSHKTPPFPRTKVSKVLGIATFCFEIRRLSSCRSRGAHTAKTSCNPRNLLRELQKKPDFSKKRIPPKSVGFCDNFRQKLSQFALFGEKYEIPAKNSCNLRQGKNFLWNYRIFLEKNKKNLLKNVEKERELCYDITVCKI